MTPGQHLATRCELSCALGNCRAQREREQDELALARFEDDGGPAVAEREPRQAR